MKNLVILCLVFFTSNLFAQDYIVKPDGTKLNGDIISISKNQLKFKSTNGNIDEFKVNKLSVIHIANPDFKITDVVFTNARYDKTENGIHIELLDNPVVYNDKQPKSSSKSSTTNVNIQSEKTSSISITNDDDSPKAKIVLTCDDCSNTGMLNMESEDKSSRVSWEFKITQGSAFPMELEVNSGKTYRFKYKDGNKQSIEKKVTIKSGVNYIKVFE